MAPKKRKTIPQAIRDAVLTEAGYRCAVPTCHTTLAVDLHHMIEVKKGGDNTVENLIALCPTCHALYHRGSIPQKAIVQWKQRIVALYYGHPPKQSTNGFIRPKDHIWAPNWYSISTYGVSIHNLYIPVEEIIIPTELDQEFPLHSDYLERLLAERVVPCPDDTRLAVLVGEAHIINFTDVDESLVFGKQRLHLYTSQSLRSIWSSNASQYIYSGPFFSGNNRYLVYAYADNWGKVELKYDEIELEVDYEPLVAGTWDESLCILDTLTMQSKVLASESQTGYGDSAEPTHFQNMQFLDGDRIIFSQSSNNAGVIGAWNIDIKNGDIVYQENPYVFGRYLDTINPASET
jgi:hypothetical protein